MAFPLSDWHTPPPWPPSAVHWAWSGNSFMPTIDINSIIQVLLKATSCVLGINAAFLLAMFVACYRWLWSFLWIRMLLLYWSCWIWRIVKSLSFYYSFLQGKKITPRICDQTFYYVLTLQQTIKHIKSWVLVYLGWWYVIWSFMGILFIISFPSCLTLKAAHNKNAIFIIKSELNIN